MLKRISAAAALAAVLVAAAALGVGWYYADLIKNEALVVVHNGPPPDLVVSAVGDDTIDLRVADPADLDYGDWQMPGLWGLRWNGDYARIGDIVELGDNEVVRTFSPIRGSVSPGDRVMLDRPAFEGDPLTADNLAFTPVTFESELGTLGAWRISGSAPTWAIFIHGHRATREAMLRFLPVFAAAGMPLLVIEYRNDAGVAASAAGSGRASGATLRRQLATRWVGAPRALCWSVSAWAARSP